MFNTFSLVPHTSVGTYTTTRAMKCVLLPHSHYTLVNWSNPNHKWLLLAEDAHNYSPKVGIIAYARSVISIPLTTDLTTARSLRLKNPNTNCSIPLVGFKPLMGHQESLWLPGKTSSISGVLQRSCHPNLKLGRDSND